MLSLSPTQAISLNPYRARLYRAVLILAAAYNLAFGAWAGFVPGMTAAGGALIALFCPFAAWLGWKFRFR